MFGTHVTVVRPQEVNLEHAAWLKYQGQELTFFYQWFCQGNYGTRTSCSATYYNPPPPDPPVYAPGCAYRLSGVPIAFASGYSTPHAPCTIICYGTGPSAVCDIF